MIRISHKNEVFLKTLQKRLEELSSTYELLVFPEFRFDAKRKWRFDFAISKSRNDKPVLAIEIEGGTRSDGRHTTGSGYAKDLEKYNKATEYGIPLLRYTYENNVYAIIEQSKIVLDEQRKKGAF